MRAWTLWTLCITPALTGCVFTRDAIKLPSQTVVTGDQLILHSESPLERERPLIDELGALRHAVAARLQLPVSGEPVHLYLFDAADRFDSFVQRQHPDFPNRRAFFVADDGCLKVYACRGARIAEDLRHEVTHGYLHAMVPQLPLWLDEGLAEYFEVPPDQRGLNRPHVVLLRERHQGEQWAPDLPRLEQLQSSREMTQQDYAESWAWVHLLLESSASRRAWLCQYVASLQATDQVPPLSAILATVEPDAASALIKHLRRL